MSRFFLTRFDSLIPYQPGEQPQDGRYIKLNTNESPFAPSEAARIGAAKAAENLQLYPDPDMRQLTAKLSEYFGVGSENVMIGNGSDEILNFAFMAFCDRSSPAVFADVTYGFYPVFSDVHGIPYRQIPLCEDLSISPEDYFDAGGTIFLANPNAHTGIALARDRVEDIIKNNPDHPVIVDEAYVDFGAESCIDLTKKYDNLLVIQTMSKSRSLAGARLGFAIGHDEMIKDLNTLRNSNNPYNINSMTMAAAEGALEDEAYFKGNCARVIETREYTTGELERLGFELTDSEANFIFMKHPEVDGKSIYEKLRSRGILVRHFDSERICQYNRVTIGSREQMEIFIKTLEDII